MRKYTVSLTTKLKPPQTGLIAIEPEDYTAAEVKALKSSGAKVLASCRSDPCRMSGHTIRT